MPRKEIAKHENRPESGLRARVLAAYKAMRTSWISFADMLRAIHAGSEWKAWGFCSFEQWAAHDLDLSPSKAAKLVEQVQIVHELQLAAVAPGQRLVGLIERAERRDDLDHDRVDQIIDGIRSGAITEEAARRELARMLRAATLPGMEEATDAMRLAAELRKAAKLAEGMNAHLSEQIAELLVLVEGMAHA